MSPNNAASLFEDLINRRALRNLAGSRYYARGEEYYSYDAVHALVEDGDVISARVDGTREYKVMMKAAGDELDYSCSCPIGAQGEFCKHLVATGLAWLEEETKPAAQRATTITSKDIRTGLNRMDKKVLVEMLMERAQDDTNLRNKLVIATAPKGKGAINLAVLKRAIDDAVRTGDYVDYYEVHDYANGVDEAVNMIDDLLEKGHATEVVELAEYTLVKVDHALSSIDDSDGYMSGILEDLYELHYEACKKARPDPVALAKRIYRIERDGEFDLFHGAAERYAKMLGREGLAEYRRLAEEEWKKIRPLTKESSEERYGKRFRITKIMESLARASGNVEELVAIKSRDLSYPYHYLEIAEIYKKARRHDEALMWAEKGIAAFPKREDSRLLEFLAEEYHRRKRHDDAMAQIWRIFSAQPACENYKLLKSHADRISQWPQWREKALSTIRAREGKTVHQSMTSGPFWLCDHGHSTLVEIFLWEKDVDVAWKEACEGGCSDSLWHTLAGKREIDHPEDAYPVYRRLAEKAVARTNNEGYREAIAYIKKVRENMVRCDCLKEFDAYLAELRVKHKPKRNFMNMLDAVKWK